MAPPNGGAFDFQQKVLHFGSTPSQTLPSFAISPSPLAHALEVDLWLPLNCHLFSIRYRRNRTRRDWR
jgi:hypothetical protein